MDYTPHDALTDAGTTFVISIAGGVGASIYTNHGPAGLWAFAIPLLVLLVGFTWIMERNRNVAADADSDDEEDVQDSGSELHPRQTMNNSPRYYN